MLTTIIEHEKDKIKERINIIHESLWMIKHKAKSISTDLELYPEDKNMITMLQDLNKKIEEIEVLTAKVCIKEFEIVNSKMIVL